MWRNLSFYTWQKLDKPGLKHQGTPPPTLLSQQHPLNSHSALDISLKPQSLRSLAATAQLSGGLTTTKIENIILSCMGVEVVMVVVRSCSRWRSVYPGRGGGVLAVYMTGRSDVFFWIENLHPRYFLGQEICHVFFYVLSLFDWIHQYWGT